MKICLINGSPKHQDSTSGRIIDLLKSKLDDDLEYSYCNTASTEPQELINNMRGSHAIVIVFPLYIDGIPSHLLRLYGLEINISMGYCSRTDETVSLSANP